MIEDVDVNMRKEGAWWRGERFSNIWLSAGGTRPNWAGGVSRAGFTARMLTSTDKAQQFHKEVYWASLNYIENKKLTSSRLLSLQEKKFMQSQRRVSAEPRK